MPFIRAELQQDYLLQPGSGFADGGEDRQQVGHNQELAYFFAEVVEFESASLASGADVQPDENAEAHAVHLVELGEVEDDALVVGHELGDRDVEEVGGFREQLAMAEDDDSVALVFDGECEEGRGWAAGHKVSVEAGI